MLDHSYTAKIQQQKLDASICYEKSHRSVAKIGQRAPHIVLDEWYRFVLGTPPGMISATLPKQK